MTNAQDAAMQEWSQNYHPGEMLPAETENLLRVRLEDLTNTLCNTGFTGPNGLASQEAKDTGILAITALGAERALLRSLLERSMEAKAALPRV